MLGALASDLSAIACFFDQPWTRLSPAITGPAEAWLLNEASTHLRSLGRPVEALDPARASLEKLVNNKHWKEAAKGAVTLSQIDLTLGKVAAAGDEAYRAVIYADRSGNLHVRMTSRATLANCQYQAGRLAEANLRFQEAEMIQAIDQPTLNLLYSVPGYEYCAFLLANTERCSWQVMLASGGGSERAVPFDSASDDLEGKAVSAGQSSGALQSCHGVFERAKRTLKWEETFSDIPVLDGALHRLTVGRVSLYSFILESLGSQLPVETSYIVTAVNGLRYAAAQQYLPSALITRARLRFLAGARSGAECAQADLDEAWEIAERGPMPLYLADIHLYRARLFHDVTPYPWGNDADGKARGPKDDLAAARAIIERCGYWRRKQELEDAEAAAKNW